MLKKIFIAFLPLGTIAVILWLALPEYRALQAAKSVRAASSQALEEKRQLVAKIKNLEAQYHRIEEASLKVAQIIPPTPDIPNLLAEIPAIVLQHGMLLDDLSFAGQGTDASSARSGQEQVAYKSMDMHLVVKGSYEALKILLEALEKELRIVDVQSLQFSVSQDAADIQPISFSISAKLYYGLGI